MMPYTHLSVGLALAEAVYPKETQSWLLVVLGSLVIDVPSVSKFLLDKLRNKDFTEWGKLSLTMTKISHSLLVCLISLISWPVAIGVYSHLTLDLVSHKRQEQWGGEIGWLWPLPWQLRLSFLDYRQTVAKAYSGSDLIITFSCLTIFALLIIF